MSSHKNTHWQPTASRDTLQQRADVFAAIREFFSRRKVLEVHTPVITEYGVTDIHIDSFELSNNDGYLRTSPEYAHKRLLAAGYGDIYELGPVFRRGEAGRWHHPEFTMLEWYRVDWHYMQLAEEVVELLQAISPDHLSPLRVNHFTYADLARQIAGIDDIHKVESRQLAELAGKHGWDAGNDNIQRSILLDFLFSHIIQPELTENSITLIYDFPTCQAALAQCRDDDQAHSPVAERFELFIGRLELANGYQELTDSKQLARRFDRDNHLRQQAGRPEIPVDQKLLQAMEYGLPVCAGVALGVDRLLNSIQSTQAIASQIAFASNTD